MDNNVFSTHDDEPLWEQTRHLYYELHMFLATGFLLSNLEPVRIRSEIWIKNALEESFVIHFRVLHDFFYGRTKRKYDITAQDFMKQMVDWKKVRVKQVPLLAKAKKRANFEIAHLTKNRVDTPSPEKIWPTQEIITEMLVLIEKFINNASPHKLHPKFIELVKSWKDPEFIKFHANEPHTSIFERISND